MRTSAVLSGALTLPLQVLRCFLFILVVLNDIAFSGIMTRIMIVLRATWTISRFQVLRSPQVVHYEDHTSHYHIHSGWKIPIRRSFSRSLQ